MYIYLFHFLCLLSLLITFFFSYHISYTFRVILYCISCYCNCILSSHSSAILLISYHILYTFPLHILFIFFYVHACEYHKSGYGRELYVPESTINVLYLYVPEGTITVLYLYVPEGTITMRDSDLYLYVPECTITVRDNDLYL